jgi:hypothetical protein
MKTKGEVIDCHEVPAQTVGPSSALHTGRDNARTSVLAQLNPGSGRSLNNASGCRLAGSRAVKCVVPICIHQVMTLDTLPQYNGASVRVLLDGAPALALIFLQIDCVQVTSLCFLGGSRRCPLVRHHLNEAEIESITPVSRNELNSGITLTSAKKTTYPAAKRRRKDEHVELEVRLSC